jgi:ubiquinone/menaquinone biosynthesis C-methylase UbiE
MRNISLFLLCFFVIYSLCFTACKPNVTSPTTPAKTDLPTDLEELDRTNIRDQNQGRDVWQKRQLVIAKLGDLTDKVVADIGAGTGYFAFRIVLEAKKVIAIDIDPEMIKEMEYLKEVIPAEYKDKIETRLAEPHDPHLNPFETDIAIIINTLGYIDNRGEYLRNLRKSIKHGGKIMIVDFKMKNLPDNVAPSDEYRLPLFEVENILQAAGYTNIVSDDTSLDYQYIIIAKNP